MRFAGVAANVSRPPVTPEGIRCVGRPDKRLSNKRALLTSGLPQSSLARANTRIYPTGQRKPHPRTSRSVLGAGEALKRRKKVADYYEEFVTGRPGIVLARDKNGNPTMIGQNGCQERLSQVSSMRDSVASAANTIWSAVRRGVDGPRRSAEGDRPNGLPTP